MEHKVWRFWMTKLDTGLITALPASYSGSAAVWGSKRINPRPQSCLCLTWSGCPSNDDDDNDLVVCILSGLNHPRTRKRFRVPRAYRIKWDQLPSDKKMRHSFASKVASLFREFLDYTEDVETEWDLFKSAVITSAAASCGWKRVGGQMGSEKRTAWWNQEVKEAICAKKTVFRAWLTNKSFEQLRLRYSAARKTATTIVKQSKFIFIFYLNCLHQTQGP